MSWPQFSKEEVLGVSKILRSGKVNYWTGNFGKKFEKLFSKKFRIKYSVAVSNGTVGLEAALKCLGIKKKDSVIVTAKSYFSSASCVVNIGAKPIFCDVDLNSQNISIDNIKKIYSKKIKAVILVHLGGVPCNMDEIMKFAKKKNIKVIEDCSQAHGAKFKNKFVGSFGDVAVWSCCNDKIISTGGEGGIVATNNKKLWLKLWSMKDIGKDYYKSQKRSYSFKYLHDSFGTNLRMTEVQSYLGYSQLLRIEKTLTLRRKIHSYFYSFLKELKCINLQKFHEKTILAPYVIYFFLNFDYIKKNYSIKKIIADLNRKKIPINTGSCSEIYLEKAFKKLFNSKIKPLKNAKALSQITLAIKIDPTWDGDYLLNIKNKIFHYFKKIEC